MRTTIIALAVTLLAFTGQAFSQATKFPQRGFQFRCERHINYHGWQCDGGGFYEKKDVPAGTVITSHNMENWMECCVNTFSPYKKVGFAFLRRARSAVRQSLSKNMGGGRGAAAAGPPGHAQQLAVSASCLTVRPTCFARPPSAPLIRPPTCVGARIGKASAAWCIRTAFA
jgi:hypothetical protein